MLTRDFQQQNQPDNAGAKTALARNSENRENWLEFCMFPDLVEPVRMPSLFPVPTHIVRRQQVVTIAPTATGNIFGVWKPHTIQTHINGVDDEASIEAGYRSAFHYKTVAITSSNADNDVGNEPKSFTSIYNPSISTVSGLVHGGCRLIGAFIEIEYIGTADMHAGLIECGVHMHSANTALDLVRVHAFTQGEIIQAPFYRKFKPSEGVRCVWFPADDDAFNFQDYDVTPSGTGQSDPNALTVDIGSRLQQINLRNPVYPEWAINMTGLSLNQNVRLHMCSYYETVPDEEFKDIYMAKKTRSTVDTGRLKSAVTEAVQSEMVATAAKTSMSWGGFRQQAISFIDGLSRTYGIYQDVRNGMGALKMLF